MSLFDKLKDLLSKKPKVADASQDDRKIVATDNSGEPGQPVENQDPTYIPEGSVL